MEQDVILCRVSFGSHRLSVDFEAVVLEIDNPVFRNSGACVDGGFRFAVKS